MLTGCGRRSIVNHDVDGQIMLLTKKAEEKIKKIKEIEKNAEGKLNKKSGSGQQETPIKETETEVDEPKIHMSFSKYIYFSAIITGSAVAFIGDKTSDYKTCSIGLLLVSAGAVGGINRLLETSNSEEGEDEMIEQST